jgi:phosphomannomutase/phosphoglucomutase
MKIPRHAFREYDIRGVADADLSDELARALGRSFVAILSERAASSATATPVLDGGDPQPPGTAVPLTPRIAVGRDGRRSSDRLFAALTDGLLSAGADVISVGVGPTPLLYFAAHHLGTDGAVMITASHNPGPDNGFKLMRGKASFFGADVQALADRIETEEAAPESDRGPDATVLLGRFEERDLAPDYIAAVRRSSRLEGNLGVRLVVDAGNGSAGPLGLATLRALGFDVPDDRALYCDIDGSFPNHHPDPTVPENLEALRARVKATGALLGIAWDGDGDRIGVVDEEGEIVWGDKLLLLFARTLLREHPGATVLGEVKCSETLYADIEAHGGRPLMWKTGHSLIKTKMRQENALLAGEMSGHMFFADRWPGFDDAIYATVRLLEIVAREGKGLRQLLADVPVTFATPEIRVDCPDAHKLDAVQRVLARYRPTHKVVDIDGARIDFGGGAWGLCRASNTGPILVLRFEARSEARRDEIRREVEGAVTDAINLASARERPPTRRAGGAS